MTAPLSRQALVPFPQHPAAPGPKEAMAQKSQPQAIILADCPLCHNEVSTGMVWGILGMVGSIAMAVSAIIRGLSQRQKNKPKPQQQPPAPQTPQGQ